MNNLNSFLNPKRKPNLKFVVSPDYVDKDGKPIEWEMRQLTGKESILLASTFPEGISMTETLARCAAESIVYPDLRNKELQDGISEKIGHRVLDPYNVLINMVTDPELGRILSEFSAFNSLTFDLEKRVDEAKN
ncbi:Phage XkdN-like tail assembly chaperone protein, TAC [Caprobacter fermentans]|uniref:Phage XkdN-like tail assembly chaperone protein, TAC n=1 Tax=Caproicibacter fermentans TaxID=2576756 RepID=A0A6N8HZT8_9FIRM|nr:hypothetical protein [Caproicibacter fermentans]MVB11346.1 Phage XkdN-like tail assembly chaperone protein, TAC [Caproicibacter fermentans]